jgi:threonyl-tRNA synthetase
MYPPMQLDEEVDYYPKPMNCPFHMLIFRSHQRSYRELPMRLFELGTVYRYERSGVLHGLMRIRGFTQDDSHIFCTPEQAVDEITSLLEFVLSVLRAFGFDDFEANLSTRPEDKSVGADDEWDRAIDALDQALERSGLDYEIDEGGGAFYGPKIDVKFHDAIGREWQGATIQLDFQLPERFQLEYTGEDNHPHRPVMIHRAIFGTLERFTGFLIEHFAGAFPLWIAPVQAVVIPIADRHLEPARELAAELVGAGLRFVEVDDSDNRMQNKIRLAQGQKIPYMLILGDREVEARTASVRRRDGSQEQGVGWADLAARLGEESRERRLA